MMKPRFEHIPPGQTDPDPLPGDFILTHGGEFWSRVIHFGQGLRFTGKDQPYTYWNHAALIVSADGAIIEALGPGVQRNTLASYQGTQYTIVHIDASDEDRKEMVAFAEHWVGKAYDWATIVSITLSLLTGAKLSFGFPGQLICSGLVARALERTTANAPSATPLATATATSAAPTSSASATQTTTNAALGCTAPATALVELTEGPYYKANPPQNATLRAAGVTGTPLTLTGYVVSKACQPIANAKLDFWQSDGSGNYDTSGYTLRGWQLTDANGAYRLETVIPGLYPGRTEHIHFKVTVNGQTYTSQLFFPGVSQNASDSIYSSRLLVTLNTTTST